ncbi:MAG: DegT/DnrJ/EryC1/StrS family aminotransferase [Acidimicrobiales bacterium]
MIPYGRQHIDDADIEAVTAVLRSPFITQGPVVEEFEAELCRITGAAHAIAFANGTAALHAACHAGELGPGERLVTTPLTFIASANCAKFVGADVGFVDIDPATLNIDVEQVPQDADALVAVHYAGLPVQLDRLAHRPRLVIEDASHAIGAIGPDGPVGNCARSDMTTFSFHPVKTITSGEGGAVTTNDDRFAERLRRFRTHGIIRKDDFEPWYYEAVELGYNYRLTDFQAALGRSQLTKLDNFIERRNELAAVYDRELAELDLVRAPDVPAGQTHGRHLYPVRVDDRDGLAWRLRAAGIGTQVHYVPVHLHPLYRRTTAGDRATSRTPNGRTSSSSHCRSSRRSPMPSRITSSRPCPAWSAASESMN